MPAPGGLRARVASAPASSANLGPGFDCLAVALDLRVEVRIEPADRLAISADGEGSDLPATAEHLAARVLRDVLGHDRATLHVRSEIPVGRGLGSSAALAAAAAAAAGADDPLAVAARLDGHPENAAASVRGGLVAATTLRDGQAWAVSLPLDPRAAFVVLVPDQGLSTERARAALPAEIPHADAARNLGRLGVLIGALGDLDLYRTGLMDDQLHQPYRSSLMPQAGELIRGLEEAGALGAAWSGAGPSIVAVCLGERAGAVAEAGSALLRGAGIAGDARLLTPDMRGLQVAEA